MRLFVLLIPLLSLIFGFPLFGQESRSRKKPVLIRVDPTADKVEEVPPERDPQKAKEHVEIGDFYYKRENYKAAAERYREAIRRNPQWVKAYEKLIGVLEKQNAFVEALKVCEQFVQRNDSSKEVERFQEWSIKLKEKAKETG